MSVDFLISVVAALTSLAAGGIASSEELQKLLRRLLGRAKRPERPFAERLAELTQNLTKASSEVDAILAELAQVAQSRQTAVDELESKLTSLESKEQDLKAKVEALERTPLPVAEHFARLLEVSEKRSAKRDYVLFGAGVVVTTMIAIAIKLLAG